MHEENDILNFNFWPSFADLMLSLVFILVLILFLVTIVITAGTVNLGVVQRNQQNMIGEIAGAYQTEPVQLRPDVFGISTEHDRETQEVIIRNEPTLQRITF